MSTKSEVLIIGYGTVGHNLAEELSALKKRAPIAITDKYKLYAENLNADGKYKFGFVCVDTPLVKNEDGELTLDVTEVKNAILENDCELYIIKSTCPVGTVEKFKIETGKRIVFSPEYYGGTQHCNNFEFDFTIVGGDKNDCVEVVQLLQNVYDGRHQFRITDSKTAEMVKFMENSWLATKVSFCCSFAKTANMFDVNYEELRELFVLDPRVNPSHTFVYKDRPYFDSHCLNKDVPAIAAQGQNEFLKNILKINEKEKKRFE